MLIHYGPKVAQIITWCRECMDSAILNLLHQLEKLQNHSSKQVKLDICEVVEIQEIGSFIGSSFYNLVHWTITFTTWAL